MRKKVTNITIALLFVLTGIFACIGVARADGNSGAINSNIEEVLNSARLMCESSRFTTTIADRWQVVTSVRDEVDTGAIMETIIEYLAVGLVTLNIFLTIIREAMRGDPSMDYWFKVFAVMAVSLIAIASWQTIMKGIDEAGEHVIEAFTDFANANSEDDDVEVQKSAIRGALGMLVENGQLEDADYESVVDEIQEMWARGDNDYSAVMNTLAPNAVAQNNNYKASIGMTIRVGVFNLLRIGYICAVDAQLFMIAIQMLVRRLGAPIAIAGISADGMRSSCIRYLKRYFSLYLQFVIILIISALFYQILLRVTSLYDASGIVGTGMGLYVIITCMGAMIAMVAQSGSLAAEILGD